MRLRQIVESPLSVQPLVGLSRPKLAPDAKFIDKSEHPESTLICPLLTGFVIGIIRQRRFPFSNFSNFIHTMRQSPPIHWVVQACLIWLTLLSASVAASLPNYSNDLSSATADGSTDIATIQARGTKPFMLRILPLGASITQGYKSKDGNGYRKWLRQQLRYAGWEVDMIGSKKTGTMHNNVSYTR
jgi:hypothetical protein